MSNQECSGIDRLANVDNNVLADFRAHKVDQVVAITTPIPDARGNISTKTPIYHLPVYSVHLKTANNETLNFKCDLADMADLLAKLKELKNQWTNIG
jgi:hypothetical protein